MSSKPRFEHDVEKFTKFYQEHFPKVVEKLVERHFTRADAEDIAQLAFENLWKHYDDNYFLYNVGYFYKYVVNYAMMDFKRRKIKHLERKELYQKLQRIDYEESQLIEEQEKKKLQIFKKIKELLPKKWKAYFSVAFWEGIAVADKKVFHASVREKENFLNDYFDAWEKIKTE